MVGRSDRRPAIGTPARMTLLGALAGAALAGLGLLAPAAGAATGISLLLPQSTAFSVLGASCGGIQEQALATGFDAVHGYPTAAVYLQTRCGGSGRGGGYHSHTYSAWVSVTWDFAGAVQAYTKLAAQPAGLNPAFSATDAHGDQLSEVVNGVNVPPANCVVVNTTYCTYRAYFKVVPPGTPTGVTAVQVGDQFKVGWKAGPATAPLITSSTVTATPVASSAPVLTATVGGAGASALVGPLQPLTTYRLTVVNSDAGGSSPASSPVTASTPASRVVPSTPTGVAGIWTAPQQPGDTLGASWADAVPGDSPIDGYQVTVTAHDAGGAGGGPFTQAVSGSTLGAGFVVDDSLDWAIQVRAHNAAGWGPWSAAVVLPAA